MLAGESDVVPFPRRVPGTSVCTSSRCISCADGAALEGSEGPKQPLPLLCWPGSLLSSYPPGPKAGPSSLLRTAPTLTPPG